MSLSLIGFLTKFGNFITKLNNEDGFFLVFPWWQKNKLEEEWEGNKETDSSDRFQLSVSSLPPKTDSFNTNMAESVAAIKQQH